MVFSPDLEPTEFPNGKKEMLIGWLSSENPFSNGEVLPEFLKKLKEFILLFGESGCSQTLGWGAVGGFHTCDFCNQFLGIGRIAVPDNLVLYIAPQMIGHYVEVHHYFPPIEFINAVLKSPLPGTNEFNISIEPFCWRDGDE